MPDIIEIEGVTVGVAFVRQTRHGEYRDVLWMTEEVYSALSEEELTQQIEDRVIDWCQKLDELKLEAEQQNG
jgi:hypothetical protein